MDTRPIGIIDSGSGGLSIWKALISLLPNEVTIYIGDHAQLPYSDKTQKFIRNRVVKLIRELIKQNCKMCVVACNTATVAGIDWYRKQFPSFPIVGVVPVIKTAAALTKTNHIMVLSTLFTAKSAYQKKLIQTFASDKTVFSVGSTRLVSLIESSKNTRKEIDEELKKIRTPHLSYPIDVVVLGCTHYPFVKDQIHQLFGHAVSVIDSGDAVARHVARILTNIGGVNTQHKATHIFFTTGDAAMVSAVVSKLLNQPTVVEHVLIP